MGRIDPGLKIAILVGLAVAGAALLWAIGPIERTTYTVSFADQRAVFGVPHFFNIVSNLPFAIVGAIGLAGLGRRPAELRPALAVLYAGIFLTAFGSAYHHLAPSFDRLLWDRLPMTLAFAGVLAAALADRVDVRAAGPWLAPIVAAAMASAIYWHATGQLRPYVFVQGYPMIAVPAMLLLYPRRHLDGRHFFAAVAVYGLAKICERHDAEIFELGNLVSGHTLKHLVAGWATWHLVAMATPRSRESRVESRGSGESSPDRVSLSTLDS
jgi:hypothetical protein